MINLRQANSKKQGDVGLGVAIGFFVAKGYTVPLPLTDSQDYDLIVDSGGGLSRVQVRTVWNKNRYGIFECHLRVNGGNKRVVALSTLIPKL